MLPTEKKMFTEREKMQQLLARVPAKRKPALRRSESEDHLFATDLPELTDTESLRTFRETLLKEGWTSSIVSGWLLMDRVPPEKIITAERSAEAEACAAILERHSAQKNSGDREWRMLYKACEQGGEKEEKAFRTIHGELAQALREHRSLPDLWIRWEDESIC